MLIVAPFFKGTTINKNKRLDHESLRCPETDILRYHEYKPSISLADWGIIVANVNYINITFIIA